MIINEVIAKMILISILNYSNKMKSLNITYLCSNGIASDVNVNGAVVDEPLSDHGHRQIIQYPFYF